MEKKLNINPISLSVTPIWVCGLDTQSALGVATGFIYKHSNQYYLVTNWHNVTGFNTETGKRIDEQSLASPTKLVVYLAHSYKIKTGEIAVDRKQITLSLYCKDQKPKWLIHPQYSQKVDVVALKLEDNVIPESIKCINDDNIEYDDNIPIEVSDDVFIIGYPYNYQSGKKIPIWKRGTVASEPDINYDDLPLMLIDTSGGLGMSGSPVIFKRVGIHGFKRRKTNRRLNNW